MGKERKTRSKFSPPQVPLQKQNPPLVDLGIGVSPASSCWSVISHCSSCGLPTRGLLLLLTCKPWNWHSSTMWAERETRIAINWIYQLIYRFLRIRFRWDRQWVIVNSKGRAYTQRVEPKLALIEVELPKDAFKEDWVPTDGSYLVLRAPEMDVLEVPLDKSCKIIEGISVWEWSGSAYDEGHEAAEWLTKYIGKPSCLMRFNTAAEVRNVDPNYALGHKTTFSDGFPFMVISQGSLNALNALLKEPLPINRFRPNILVDGCQPFSEDMWKVLKVNNLTFHGVKLCSRCKVPTINQDNGIAGDEPTETLMKFRSDKVLRNTEKNGKVYFGQNLVWKELSSAGKEKVVKIGDPIYVLERFSSFLDAPI